MPPGKTTRGAELQDNGGILYPPAIVKSIKQGHHEKAHSTCCGEDGAAPGKRVAHGEKKGEIKGAGRRAPIHSDR